MLTQNETQIPAVGLRSSSRATSLIGVFLILLSVTAFAFFVRPFSASVDVLKSDILTKTQELDGLNKKIADMEAAEKNMGLASELDKLEMQSSIPVGLKQDEAIKDIIQLITDHNITLTSIGFGKGATDKSKIGVLQVSAGFDGTYEDLMEFLKALEQNKRLFRVNSIGVQLIDTDIPGLKKATFSLSMDTFFQQ